MKAYTIEELEQLWIQFLIDSNQRNYESIEIEDFFYYLYELENRDSDLESVPGES